MFGPSFYIYRKMVSCLGQMKTENAQGLMHHLLLISSASYEKSSLSYMPVDQRPFVGRGLIEFG